MDRTQNTEVSPWRPEFPFFLIQQGLVVFLLVVILTQNTMFFSLNLTVVAIT